MTLSFDVFDLDFPVGSPNKSAVLVSGPTEAVLVDAGFTRADGHRLVAAVLDSGKTLTTVFVSHADPDFYFGLEVVADAFPEAAIVATPIVIEHIHASFEGKLTAWAALGANLPTRLVEISPLTSDSIEIDGEVLELRGGSEALPDRHYLWYPEQRAILGGVLVFQQEHVWTADTATPEQRSAWVELLDEMLALDPDLVVPGHRLPETATDASALQYTRAYLVQFENVLAEAADGAAATALLAQKYPDSGMMIAAQIGPKVAKGEMTWG
ncbi:MULTISPECIES: MBL fold metallo-hydrolase [unclassified Rathayibacter]|uniref:MBL fold metallo-hydrolase n=1 Tax=unclassified Rathayibacter TaxID=2609250 RepID=UPI0006F34861|nr:MULTISPECIES: MBL fold metallo-hydrolase [unclassified Rathayibacter]KQQ03454.1 MBL fold metallo-hydrolase [Rathayibacter sp. Leaf294]KQS11910.1 MBL fold metallo-hydrolase [Rathayibacter sp. Leaf185]